MLYKTRVQDSEITFSRFPEKNLAKPLQFFKPQLLLISPRQQKDTSTWYKPLQDRREDPQLNNSFDLKNKAGYK
jgi:hypothetical protein